MSSSISKFDPNKFSQPLVPNEQKEKTEEEDLTSSQEVSTAAQLKNLRNKVNNLETLVKQFSKRKVVDLTQGEQPNGINEQSKELERNQPRKDTPLSARSSDPQQLIPRDNHAQSTTPSPTPFPMSSNTGNTDRKRVRLEGEVSSPERMATETKEIKKPNPNALLEQIAPMEHFPKIRKSIETDEVKIDEVFGHIDKLKNEEKGRRSQSAPSVFAFTYTCELKILEATLNLHVGEYEKALNCLDFSPDDRLYYIGSIISNEHLIKSNLLRIRALNDLCIINSILPIEFYKKEYNKKLEGYYQTIEQLNFNNQDLNLAIKIERAKTLNVRNQHKEALALLRSIEKECPGSNDPNIFARFQCELGWALFGCGNIDEAYKEITKIESIKTAKNILAWSGYLHSKFLFSMNHLSQANLILEKAFYQESPNKNIKFLLLSLYKNIRDKCEFIHEGSDTELEIDDFEQDDS